MIRWAAVLPLLILPFLPASAQDYNELTDDGTFTEAGSRSGRRDSLASANKEIPKRLVVWTVDDRFGERRAATPDTLPHMYMNSIFTTGLRGEYNTTGNLGAPRINRMFIDRPLPDQFMFTQPYDYFITPVDRLQFTNTLSPITNLTYNQCGDHNYGEDHFKALFAVNAGKRLGVGFNFDYIYGRGYYQNQSTSHFNYTLFASYLGDHYSAHFIFSTNHEKVTENGGITDDRYVTHPEAFDDSYRSSEIPTELEYNWNRNDNQHIFLSHRYSLGFNRKVPMTEEEIKAKKFAIESMRQAEEERAREEARRKAAKEGREFDETEFESGRTTYSGRPDDAAIAGNEPAMEAPRGEGRITVDKETADSLAAQAEAQAADTSWIKNEFVPVTSFIHTLKFDIYKRIYQAYYTPADYYLDTYDTYCKWGGDSIYDATRHYSLRNTLGIALLEGFNKYAKAGLRAFVTSDLRHFSLPDTGTGTLSYNEHDLSVGAQLLKQEGRTLHYGATAEFWVLGASIGQVKVDADADLNFRFLGDTVSLGARFHFYNLAQTFYFRHYHSRHLWWDNEDLDNEIRMRVEGVLNIRRTRTTIRVGFDDLRKYTYLAQRYDVLGDDQTSYSVAGNTVSVEQAQGNISLLTLQLSQDFSLGPLRWENQVTYQKSSNQSALPVPALNVYTNLYLHFLVAHVLTIDLGGDLRYFTKYKAPGYSPALGQYAVQDNGDDNVDVGGYPFINVYANLHLKHTRFFAMFSHVNATAGNYFLTPHYPTNGRLFRFGVSWNFFN